MAVATAVAAVLVVGSLAEVHAQSGAYRSSTDAGYGALASRVADASNQTGTELASLIAGAPALANLGVPKTARTELQLGLDDAVRSSEDQVDQADQAVPPEPSKGIGDQFSQVMQERASGTADLRQAIDQLLGMTPLPIAGAPAATAPVTSAPIISIDQASAAMTEAGGLFQRADDRYRALIAEVRAQRVPMRLSGSVWVPDPVDRAPLGPTRLGASAALLSGSAALVPYHQLVITAVGLVPPAVPSGGPGIIGTGCSSPQSTVPGAATVIPPTGSLSAEVTVTNCGTVPESGVVVSETLTLADPPGTALPPPAARGNVARTTVDLVSGASTVPALPPMTVAPGHSYDLTLAIALAANQGNTGGSSQGFLVQISR